MNKKLALIAGFLAIVAVVGIAVQQALPAAGPAAQPKVTWSSPDVYAGITRTTTVTKAMTLTSNQGLQAVSLEAVPEIAQFVQIQPKSFATIAPGQPQTVQLTFRAPAGAQFGAYDGTIQVRSGAGTIPQTLKTSITFAVVPLPPDPGDAGDKPLEGIDSDRDGVRDDIQRYIFLTNWGSAKTRAALTQYAKAQQTFLMQANNKQGAITAATLRDRAKECLYYVLGVSQPAFAVVQDLRARFLNTPERSRAYIKSDGHLGGVAFPGVPVDQEKAQCTFNPDTMEISSAINMSVSFVRCRPTAHSGRYMPVRFANGNCVLLQRNAHPD